MAAGEGRSEEWGLPAGPSTPCLLGEGCRKTLPKLRAFAGESTAERCMRVPKACLQGLALSQQMSLAPRDVLGSGHFPHLAPLHL